jgi:hypothetical protein
MTADQLVATYIKIRTAKEKLVKDCDAATKVLQAQMDTIEGELLELCKTTGQDGGKTAQGTFTRTVKTRYWTSDWESMYRFIKEHDAPELLERRVAQGTFKEFLDQNPGLMPEGMNVDNWYAITVRRPTKS